MLIEVFLIKIFNKFRQLSINTLEVHVELSARCHVCLFNLPFEAVLQLLHDDVPKCFFDTCSCSCIVVCVMLSIFFVVIQSVF
jgi:hypothetical protein